MEDVLPLEVKNISLPSKNSHKGQNGRLLIIGGSQLFHSASLWALKVASRMVDLVHYSSVKENNQIVEKLKTEFRDGIVVPRLEIEDYIGEDDCVLIGPGMVRAEDQKHRLKIKNLSDVEKIDEEGAQTYYLTKYLLQKYPKKKWVIDAGALQMLELEDIPQDAILTPHQGEFERLISKISNFKFQISNKSQNPKSQEDRAKQVQAFAREYKCVVVLKGEKDIVASSDQMKVISGGNAGMTKGGTGDVLAGLIAALYCRNDAFTSAVSGSYINKKAGEDCFEKMGLWFNASDLADQIPQTMKRLLL